jgi:AraC family transcriptional regulator of adaptative response/methylated-DNA-[protein]-cysteine methyltransferase
MDRLRQLIDSANGHPVSVAVLAASTGESTSRILKVFRNGTGLTPREYQAGLRGLKMREQLRAGSDVSSAGYEAGYGSSSRVHDNADGQLGMTPSAFRAGGRGMRIEFAATSTSLGILMVGYTDRGVCSVSIGDDAGTLERALRADFHAARIEPAAASAADWISRVATAVLAGDNESLRLDLSGTEFQLLVWNALRRIPRGETRSYTELAAAIGHPKATRAVASACARNRVAVIVPCHRVVRADGQLGGYRWGVDLKQRLLEAESLESKLLPDTGCPKG